MSEVIQINASHIRSLCWVGDSLVDWVGGGRVLHLDGKIEDRRVNYAYRFDAAVASPSGRYAIIYEKLGTKGLVLKGGTILREIDRSFYHAHAYEFPVAIFQRPDGREILVHCPEEYCRLEFEDIATGEPLTADSMRKPNDYFHSRLQVSNDGKWLLSAGWVWHPWSCICVFSVEEALSDPKVLDGFGFEPDTNGEATSAGFIAADQLAVGTSGDTLDEEDEVDYRVGPNALAVFDLARQEVVSAVPISEPIGTMMPLDDSTVVGFYGHPKIFSLKDGAVIRRWPDIGSGKQISSIIWNDDHIPPIACDAAHRRFAVASDKIVTVVSVPRTDTHV